MALHGRALLVTHQRRRNQDYVSTDPAHVAKDLVAMARIGWDFRVASVAFVGEGALAVLGNALDAVLTCMTPDDRQLVTWEDDCLVPNRR